MFAWELPTTPPSWDVGARFVHEIWAPSQFCVNAFERLAPGRVRLVPYPLAALPDLPVSGSRADFGIADNVLVVLVVLNVASSLVRKNPEAAIAAFRAAFGDRGDVLLIVKLSGTGFYPSDRQIIISAIGSSQNIRVIDQNLPESALRGLIAISDIVLSLHRAEGFGLIPATAMLFGRAVVATGWSGNMDFMDADSAGLVDFTLVPVVDPRGVYTQADCSWAEPDVSHAAQMLRALADDFDRRGNLAMRGKAKVLEVLGDAALRRALASSGIR
ncbi:glycosyltransferase [Acidiphilium sp.]|uniref:glycosyltransferase n=1 Tax=Acidiphilium sp. TaxID=527 RepID=UPI003D00F564